MVDRVAFSSCSWSDSFHSSQLLSSTVLRKLPLPELQHATSILCTHLNLLKVTNKKCTSAKTIEGEDGGPSAPVRAVVCCILAQWPWSLNNWLYWERLHSVALQFRVTQTIVSVFSFLFPWALVIVSIILISFLTPNVGCVFVSCRIVLMKMVTLTKQEAEFYWWWYS